MFFTACQVTLVVGFAQLAIGPDSNQTTTQESAVHSSTGLGVMECQLSDLFISPGGTTTLEVYLSNTAPNLIRGMQTGIAIAKLEGTGSSFVPCPCPCPPASHADGGVRIIDTRPDFLFFGQTGVISAVNCVTGKAVASLLSGGVLLNGPRAYLSEYEFIVSADAKPGTQFRIELLPPNDSLLVDGSNNPVPFTIADPCVFSIVALPAVTTVTLELVVTQVPASSSVVTSLPSSISSVALHDSYFVEVWGQTNDPHGLQSISMNLRFDPGLSSALAITPTPVFSEFRSGVIENQLGRIRDLSGSHALVTPPCADQLGFAPNWARLAIIEMSADDAGVQLLRSEAADSPFLGTAICGQLGDVDPSNISFEMTALTIREQLEIPALATWGVLILALLLMTAGSLLNERIRCVAQGRP